MKCSYLMIAIEAAKIASNGDNQLMREIVRQCHEAVVSDIEVHKADEVSEVKLVGEIE